MSKKVENLVKVLKNLQLPCDFWGLRVVQEKIRKHEIRNENPTENITFHDQGFMVEVMVNGHMGYAGTSDFSEAGITNTADRALQLARHFEALKIHHFGLDARPRKEGLYKSPRIEPLDLLSVAEIIDTLMAANQALKTSPSITSRTSSALLIQTDSSYHTSEGTQIHQNYHSVVTDLRATASSNGESQTRSDNGFSARSFQIGSEHFHKEHLRSRSENIGEQALELLLAKNCPLGQTNLILAPDQMLLQIHESIGHPLEIDRILGDERNFAGWSFVRPQDFGTLRYGSDLMYVTFDPHVSGEFASYRFDDAGHEAKREFLIENGILKRGLGSYESQVRSGLPGVANFRSSGWNRPPIDRMANINLEPGKESVGELIGRVENGVLMCSNSSFSIDDYRNQFQFGCEFAREIKNGQLGQVYKNPNYRGSTTQFWNSLVGISDAASTSHFGIPYCGKGEPNQFIKVGHSSPYCLFENVEVFGGGQ